VLGGERQSQAILQAETDQLPNSGRRSPQRPRGSL